MHQAAILVVEDNPDHALLIQMAIEDSESEFDVRIVPDRESAIGYLTARPSGEDSPVDSIPALIILDLGLTGASGFEVLEWLGTQPRLKDLPVFVFTSSVNPDDRKRADDLGALEFAPKPSSYPEFREAIHSFLRTHLDVDKSP